MNINIKSLKMRFYGAKDIDNLAQLSGLSEQERLAMKAIAQVLPFRNNNYIVEQLIDWDNIPDDSIFRLTFPHPEMINIQVNKFIRTYVSTLYIAYSFA